MIQWCCYSSIIIIYYSTWIIYSICFTSHYYIIFWYLFIFIFFFFSYSYCSISNICYWRIACWSKFTRFYIYSIIIIIVYSIMYWCSFYIIYIKCTSCIIYCMCITTSHIYYCISWYSYYCIFSGTTISTIINSITSSGIWNYSIIYLHFHIILYSIWPSVCIYITFANNHFTFIRDTWTTTYSRIVDYYLTWTVIIIYWCITYISIRIIYIYYTCITIIYSAIDYRIFYVK